MKKDFLCLGDFSENEISDFLILASDMKANQNGKYAHKLDGKTLMMIFEKPSTRTLLSFQVGMHQLGGHVSVLPDSSLGKRETMNDIVRTIERYGDGIMIRTFSHDLVVQIAELVKIPVINGLTDLVHPCQSLADLLTIQEHKGSLAGRKIVYIGDGFNVTNSLMIACALMGMHIIVVTPKGHEPNIHYIQRAQKIAERTQGSVTLCNEINHAMNQADVVYTDSWVSMGMEAEARRRQHIFEPFQVNQALLDYITGNPLVMHCLPAHRGQEITDEVMDGPNSVVFDQAENRLHVQKAVLATLMQ